MPAELHQPPSSLIKGSISAVVPKTHDSHLDEPTQICDFKAEIANSLEPFPHVIHNQFIRPDIYSALCNSFPACPVSTGPTGFSLYWGDEGYTQLLAQQPAWKALFESFHSTAFINWGRQQFANVWKEAGCKINLDDVRYVPYREDRIDKERGSMRKVEYEPHELWVRMDIHQGQLGYDRPIHVDHARRLISMLIYMCDPGENQMVGGELLLNSGPKAQSVVSTIVKPDHNLMVAFPCTARSYHSVSKITSLAAPRNYVQVHISSSVDIWPREPVPFNLRRKLGAIKQRVLSSRAT